MGAREYDPALGRFASADPLKGTPTDPQQRNRYTYTSNDPLVRYDLSGFSWFSDWADSVVGNDTEVNDNSDQSLNGDQERTRMGADGNGYSSCEKGCRTSGSSELKSELMPNNGTGLEVGMYKYEETNAYKNGYRLYNVRNRSGQEIIASAANPYLQDFVVNVQLAGIAANYSLLSGLTSLFTSTFFMDNYSWRFDYGPEAVSARTESAEMYFKMIEMWEGKCN